MKMGLLSENLTVRREDFWNGVKIYSQKPNSINKEVLYSEIIVSAEYETEITDKGCKILRDKFYELIFIQNKNAEEIVNVVRSMEGFTLSDKVLDHLSCNYVILRKLLPKKPDYVDEMFYEIGIFDTKLNVARFYTLFDRSFRKDCYVRFDPFVIVKFNRISVHHQSHCVAVEYDDDDLGVMGCQWLRSVFVKKFGKMILPQNSNKPKSVTNFSNEMNLLNYYKLYERLKLKYARDLIVNWEEVTDPKKYVYEDIAISTYLMLLWNHGEIPDESSRKQKFVDLGCGNGLLVYILNSEGHEGVGLDVAKRRIWDTYPDNVILKEEAVIPGPNSVYPGVDWLIGNHSDELTPWIPIMATRSGIQCQHFLLPCCPYQLNGQIYQRKNSGVSTYHEYINYVRKISELCEFETHVDRLRIPSTKKICIIGKRKDLSPEKLLLINQKIDSFIARESSQACAGNPESGQSDKKTWISEFKVRQAKQPVRNCTRLSEDLINDMVSLIASNLLKEVNVTAVEKGNLESEWNQGGRMRISELAEILSPDYLKHLKNQCKGLQTFLKNQHHVFSVSEGMVRFRNVEEMLKNGENLRRGLEYKWKERDCWFHENHPDGCPLPSELCSYNHSWGDFI